MQFYQETTDWGEHAVPNHIYLLDDSKSKMFAYVKAGTNTVFTFKQPISFSTKGRKFKPVTNTFQYNIKEEPTKAKIWKVKGSKGDSYTVSLDGNTYQCSCTGFKYHGKCKHILQVQEQVK
jgi:hypothetical protein